MGSSSLLAPPIKQSPINPAGQATQPEPAAAAAMPGMEQGASASAPGALMAPPGGGSPPSMDDLAEGLAHTSFLNAKFRDLLGKKTISKKDVFDLASETLNRGALSAPRLAKELATLPSDPDSIKAWVAQHEATTGTQIIQLLHLLHGADAPPTQPMMGG